LDLGKLPLISRHAYVEEQMKPNGKQEYLQLVFEHRVLNAKLKVLKEKRLALSQKQDSVVSNEKDDAEEQNQKIAYLKQLGINFKSSKSYYDAMLC
jgi:hypothetical protein